MYSNKILSQVIIMMALMLSVATAISVGGATPAPTLFPTVPTVPTAALPTTATLFPPTTVTKAPYVAPPTNTIPSDLEIMQIIATEMNQILPSWNPIGDPCLTRSWVGVSCNTIGFIQTIDLSNINLGVPIMTFANFSSLSQIQVIHLSNTQITGSLPDQWSAMSYLKDLDLSMNNGLNGLWPPSWNTVTMPNLNLYNATFTNIQDAWAYFCPPLPNVYTYYYTSTCLGKGATHMSKTLINIPTFALCTVTPILPGTYVASLCQPGYYYQVGSNRVVLPCTAPSTKQYTTQVCISGGIDYIGLDSTVATCSTFSPVDGQYSAPCVNGGYNTLGQDAALMSCSAPVSGQQYVTKPCFGGNLEFNLPGVDTVMASCSMAPITPGFYISATCISGAYNRVGSDRQLSACTAPSSTQYTSTACVAGDNLMTGSNTIVQTCSTPTSGYYVSAICVSGSATSVGSNTQLTSCGPASGNIVAPCVQGSFKILGTPNQAAVQVSSNGSGSGMNVPALVAGVVIVAIIAGAYLFIKRTTSESRRAMFDAFLARMKPAPKDNQPTPAAKSPVVLTKAEKTEIDVEVADHQTELQIHTEKDSEAHETRDFVSERIVLESTASMKESVADSESDKKSIQQHRRQFSVKRRPSVEEVGTSAV